ncbi:MAG: pectinesterase family protein [Tenuifilaceae bacterium]
MRKLSILILILVISSNIYGQDYNIVVSRDGTGNFRNLQEAINSIRAYMATRTTIFIKNGVYKEKIIVPSWVTNLTIIGESVEKTIITWDDHANIDKMGTFKTYTIWVQGNGFRAENITFENNAAQLGQAVAVHVDGDKSVFLNCRLLGNQDTLLTANQESRQYYENCYIEGTTDFIFGPATVWFENCHIHSKKNSYITAASTVQEKEFGYIFNRCRLTANEGITKVYLGRPWRPFAATLFMNCELGSHILPQGWENWNNPENEKTARYSEYKNTGPGSNSKERVSWSHQLTDNEAKKYTIENVFNRDDKWIPETARKE